MEFYKPRGGGPAARNRKIPIIENSRGHVVYDARFRQWMTMFYKGDQGVQTFKVCGRHRGHHGMSALDTSGDFERGRARAVMLYEELRRTGKLGRRGELEIAAESDSLVRGLDSTLVASATASSATETGISTSTAAVEERELLDVMTEGQGRAPAPRRYRCPCGARSRGAASTASLSKLSSSGSGTSACPAG